MDETTSLQFMAFFARLLKIVGHNDDEVRNYTAQALVTIESDSLREVTKNIPEKERAAYQDIINSEVLNVPKVQDFIKKYMTPEELDLLVSSQISAFVADYIEAIGADLSDDQKAQIEKLMQNIDYNAIIEE